MIIDQDNHKAVFDLIREPSVWNQSVVIGAREGSILLLVILGWYYGLFMDFRSSAILVIVFVYDLYGQVRLYGRVRFTEECYIGDAGQGGRGRRAAEQQSMQESGADRNQWQQQR